MKTIVHKPQYNILSGKGTFKLKNKTFRLYKDNFIGIKLRDRDMRLVRVYKWGIYCIKMNGSTRYIYEWKDIELL